MYIGQIYLGDPWNIFLHSLRFLIPAAIFGLIFLINLSIKNKKKLDE